MLSVVSKSYTASNGSELGHGEIDFHPISLKALELYLPSESLCCKNIYYESNILLSLVCDSGNVTIPCGRSPWSDEDHGSDDCRLGRSCWEKSKY